MAREGLLEKKGIILPPGFLTDSLRTAPDGKTPGPRTELSESLPQADGASTPVLSRSGTGADAARPAVIPGKSVYGNYGVGRVSNHKSYFVPAGQSTQMIVGATPESDYQMMAVAEALYKNFGLKRVFYSAFVPVNHDSLLPALPGGPPLLRDTGSIRRTGSCDTMGFTPPNCYQRISLILMCFWYPKCDWALRNLGEFR